MLQKFVSNKITWVDIDQPTPEDIRAVVKEFGVEPALAEELLVPSLKPYAQRYDEQLYLVLHFPLMQQSRVTQEQEIDFVIGHSFIITAHYDKIAVVEKLKKVFEVNDTLHKDSFGDSAAHIFLMLVRQLYQSVEGQIDEIHDILEDIEREIFAGKEKEMVESLSYAGRNILNLKQALDPHQEVLRSFSIEMGNFAGVAFKQRMRAIEDTYYRERKHITRLWQTISELRETNNSLLYTKQNEVMKLFTIMAFVTFPLSLLTSVFGMNTQYLPIVGWDNDFWIITGFMIFATFLMFLFFRHKKWL